MFWQQINKFNNLIEKTKGIQFFDKKKNMKIDYLNEKTHERR